MYEMPLRAYDPAIARWNRIDPVVHHGLSPYNAFDNNPIVYADPSGGNSEWGVSGGNHYGGFDGSTGSSIFWGGGDSFQNSGLDTDDVPTNYGDITTNISVDWGFVPIDGSILISSDNNGGFSYKKKYHKGLYVGESDIYGIEYGNGEMKFASGLSADSGWRDVPLVGSGITSYDWFAKGDIGRGSLYAAMAISDAAGIKALVTGAGKFIAKQALKQSVKSADNFAVNSLGKAEMSAIYGAGDDIIGGSSKVSGFISTEAGAQNAKYVSKYADEIVNAESWIGKGVWPHKPIRVVNVNGQRLVIDGHHRLEAARKIGFTGNIPYQSIPVSESGYTLEQLKVFIK